MLLWCSLWSHNPRLHLKLDLLDLVGKQRMRRIRERQRVCERKTESVSERERDRERERERACKRARQTERERKRERGGETILSLLPDSVGKFSCVKVRYASFKFHSLIGLCVNFGICFLDGQWAEVGQKVEFEMNQGFHFKPSKCCSWVTVNIYSVNDVSCMTLLEDVTFLTKQCESPNHACLLMAFLLNFSSVLCR